MKTTLFLLAAAIASANAMDLLPSWTTDSSGPMPPVSAACISGYKKLAANSAFAAAATKASADQAAVGKEIGKQCSAHFSPCKTPLGATLCCSEDADADGDWTPYAADGKAWLAAAHAVDPGAQICLYNLTVTVDNGGSDPTVELAFGNYIPVMWPSACTAADHATWEKWASPQCMAANAAFKGCDYVESACGAHPPSYPVEIAAVAPAPTLFAAPGAGPPVSAACEATYARRRSAEHLIATSTALHSYGLDSHCRSVLRDPVTGEAA